MKNAKCRTASFIFHFAFFVLNSPAGGAEETAPALPQEQARQLAESIAALQADDFDRRQQAEHDLLNADVVVLPLLRRALRKADSVEVRERLARVVSMLGWRKVKAFPKQPVSFKLQHKPMKAAVSSFGDAAAQILELYPQIETEGTCITLAVKDMPADSAMRWIARLGGLEVNKPVVYRTERYAVHGAGVPAADLAKLLREQVFAREFSNERTALDCDKDVFVITQSPEVHEIIADFLELLRKPLAPGEMAANASDAWCKPTLDGFKQARVSVDFAGTPLNEAVARLQKSTDATLVVDPTIKPAEMPALNFKLQDVALDSALHWLAVCAELRRVLYDHAVYLSPAGHDLDHRCRIYQVADIEDHSGQEVRFPKQAERITKYGVVYGWEPLTGAVVAEHNGRLIARQDYDAQEGIACHLAEQRRFLEQVRKLEPDGKPPPKPLEPSLVPGHSPPGPKTEEPSDKALHAKLAKKLSFEFNDKPLSEALEFIRRECSVNLVIAPSVTNEGDDRKVSLIVTDMKAETALEWLLKLGDLECDLAHEAIFVRKCQNINLAPQLHWYYVRDLPSVIPLSDMEAFLANTLLPYSWDAALGTSVENENGILLVMQRAEIYELIEPMFDQLRLRYQEPVFYPVRAAYGGIEPWRKREQDALEVKISLDVKEQPLTEVFKALEKQTGWTWQLEDALAKTDVPRVTLKVEDLEVGAAVAQMVKPLKLDAGMGQSGMLVGTPAFLKSQQVECALYNLSDLTAQQVASLADALARDFPEKKEDSLPQFIRAMGRRLLVHHSLVVHEAFAQKLDELRKIRTVP